MNEYVVKLVVDADGAVRGIRNARGEVVQFDKALGTAGQSGSRFKGAMDAALGLGLASIATQAVASVARIGAELAKLGADLGETDSKFAAVFGEATESVSDFLDDFANMAGLTRGQARALTADVGSIGKGAGLSGQALSSFAQQVTRAAGDLTSFSNVPIEQTFNALRSGLTGESEPLKRFGIFLNAAAIETEALKVATENSIPATSQQAKQMAALNIILQQMGSNGSLGDLERTQDSTANQARRLTAVWGDMKEELARQLLPTYGLVVDALSDATAGSQGLARVIVTTLARAVFELVGGFVALIDTSMNLLKGFAGIGEALELNGLIAAGALNPFKGLTRTIAGLSVVVNRAAQGMYALKAATTESALLASDYAIKSEQAGKRAQEAWLQMLSGEGTRDSERSMERYRERLNEIVEGMGKLEDVATPTQRAFDAVGESAERAARRTKKAADEIRQSRAPDAQQWAHDDYLLSSQFFGDTRGATSAMPLRAADIEGETAAIRAAAERFKEAMAAFRSVPTVLEEMPIDFEVVDNYQTEWDKAVGTVNNWLQELYGGGDWMENFQSMVADVSGFANALGDVFAGLSERRLQQIDAEEAREMEKYDRLLAAENLTEANREALLERRDKAAKEFEAARRKEAREQAKRDRALALFQIAIATAVKAVEAKTPFGLIAALLIGATQAAAVAARPLPALNRGGIVPGWGADRDSTLAMLTPGEMVVRRASVGPNLDLLTAMNARPGQRVGGMSRADLDYLAARIASGVGDTVNGVRIVPVVSDRQVYDAHSRWSDLRSDNEVR